MLPCIQLFRERLSENMCTLQYREGNMGYDQYTVPDTVAVEPTFVAFLNRKHTSMACQISLKNSQSSKLPPPPHTPHNTFRDLVRGS